MQTYLWLVVAIVVGVVLIGPATMLQIAMVLLLIPLLLVVFRWILR